MALFLKNDFRPDMPLAALSADWLNTVANWLNTLIVSGGDRTVTPKEMTLYAPAGDANVPYSFKPVVNDEGDGIVIEPGDVVLGPSTWIEWGAWATTTPAVTDAHTHVWLRINVNTGEEAASMHVGSKPDMLADWSTLTADVQAKTIIYPLIETTWVDGVCTSAKRLLDAIIPRAAG